MTWLRRDIRLAARKALRHPAVSGLIVVCLALGIGLNAAVFGIADAALLRPLPYDDPERLVLLHDTHRGPDGTEAQYPVSPLNFLAWRDAAESFERLEAMEIRHLNMTTDGVPRRVPAAGVTAGLFEALGVEPRLGRGFTPEEDGPHGRKVAILGHGAWQRTFDGDPEALGRTLLLDGERYEVVGVLPPDFRFLADAEIWIPLALDPANLMRGRSHYLSVLGRLADGVSPAQAAQELTAVSRRRAETRAPGEGQWNAGASDLRESLVGDARTNLVILLCAVGLVLLIACSNVTSLLLTRSMEQRAELAVRAAFGAGRTRLVRMMATESAVLTAAGAVLGLLLAAGALRALPGIGAFGSPLLADVGIDARILGFALIVSIGAGVVPGVAVAWRSSGSTLLAALEDGGRSSTTGLRGRRFQAVLVVTQICLTTALLVGAGLV
ncbi:MAG: ABC transporter permease, partial [Acidobacteriota bacterium]